MIYYQRKLLERPVMGNLGNCQCNSDAILASTFKNPSTNQNCSGLMPTRVFFIQIFGKIEILLKKEYKKRFCQQIPNPDKKRGQSRRIMKHFPFHLLSG